MANNKQRPGPRTVVPGDSPSQVTATQEFINKKIGAEFLDLEKHLAYGTGVLLDQLLLRKQAEGWLVIVKGSRRGVPLAAFLAADTYAEAVEFIGEFAARGILDWQHDKWPSKHLQAKGTLK